MDINLKRNDCLDSMYYITDESIDMVLCDPPYGTTQCKWDSIIPLDRMWLQLERIIKPCGIIVLTSAQPFTSNLISSNYKLFRYDLIWEKTTATGHLNAKKMPMRAHEIVCVFYKKLPKYNPQMTHGHKRKVSRAERFRLQSECYGDEKGVTFYDSTSRYPRSVLKTTTDKQKTSLHSTQKPVNLMEYYIKTYTDKGDTVLDFAMGSGTTGVACKRLGRNFIGIELSSADYRIAEKRILTTERVTRPPIK